MEICNGFRYLTFRLLCSFIILTIIFDHDILQNNIVEAQLHVMPSWNTSITTTQSCQLEQSDTGFFSYQGNNNQRCSVQVLSPLGSLIVIEIPEERNDTDFFLYLERKGNSLKCQNTFVVLSGDDATCSATFMHNHIEIILSINVRVLIFEVNETELHDFECPELSKIDHGRHLNQPCSVVKGYNQFITCATQSTYVEENKHIQGFCHINLMSDCNVFLGKLEVSFLCHDKLLHNQTSVLMYPSNLLVLFLSKNNIIEISDTAFNHLHALHRLQLFGNYLSDLPEYVFWSLGNLLHLDLGSNRLVTLPARVFEKLKNLGVLYLDGNQLRRLNRELFQNMKMLTYLDLANNELTELPVALFYELGSLEKLFSVGNLFETLDRDVFKESFNLAHLDLAYNRLSNLPRNVFQGLHRLERIFLDNNLLSDIAFDLFYDLVNLKLIALQYNNLEQIDEQLFRGLRSLESLSLNNNKFQKLNNNIFKGLNLLERLYLSSNQLSVLDFEIFKDTKMLTYVELFDNKFTEVPSLKELTQLTFLNLMGNKLKNVDANSFEGLAKSTELFVSQHEICECYVPLGINCSATDNRSPYLTCDRLLSDRVLVALMWVIGINALGGNVFVIVWRRKSPQKNKVQDLLLTNLAFSDFLMGVYMVIVASADTYFGQHFPMQSETWRSGVACRVAGAISIISSEASVFFVTLISIDRFICIRFPFSRHRFDRRSVNITAIITWLISIAVGVIPSILSGVNFKFYDNSHVCIGLPLALVERFHTEELSEQVFTSGASYFKNTFRTRSLGNVPGMYFSSALFLGLNCFCYLIIFACYFEIIRAVFKSSKRAKLNKDMKDQVRMTVKVAAIVATDFCCWFPVILLGILVQARILTLPPSVFAWCVTFVLPINSAINPYLYTISAIISERKRQRDSIKTHMSPNVAQPHVSVLAHDTFM